MTGRARPYEVIIRSAGKIGSKGQRYEAVLDGEVLCHHIDPEHEAARVMQKMGMNGQVAFRWQGRPFVALRSDLTRLAACSANEGRKDSIRERKYVPFEGIRDQSEVEED